jgi:hypothetical protein
VIEYMPNLRKEGREEGKEGRRKEGRSKYK